MTRRDTTGIEKEFHINMFNAFVGESAEASIKNIKKPLCSFEHFVRDSRENAIRRI